MSPSHLEVTAAAALSKMAKGHNALAYARVSAPIDDKMEQHGASTDATDRSSQETTGATTAVPPSHVHSPDHSMGGPEKA